MMNMRKRLLFSMLVLWLALSADTPRKNIDLGQYILQTWNNQNGLPQNSIRSIIQTRDGYIWMASQEGLVRFDGQVFTVFNRWNTPEIPHQEISGLREGPDGTLWIGTFKGLVSHRAGRFRYYPVDGEITLNNISSLHVDADGQVFVGTNQGIAILNDNNRVILYNPLEKDKSPVINTMIRDQQGRLLVGTDQGVYALEGKGAAKLIYLDALPARTVNTLLQSRDGTLWIGTTEGLLRVRDGQITVFTTRNGLSDHSIQTLYEDRAGRIWIGTERGGIIRLADGEMSTRTVREGLSSDNILCFLEDQEGNIWAGTYYNGVNRLWEGKFRSFADQEGMAGYMRVILQSRDGTIWLGGEAGLGSLDGSRFDNSITPKLPTSQVRALFEDSVGNLWIGTREGAVRYREGRIELFNSQNGLLDENIRAIIEDADGSILLGSTTRGVYRFKNGQIENLESIGVAHDVIRCLFRDHAGRIWIGGNTSLQVIEGRSVRTFTSQDGLPVEPVYSIHEDKDHVLWFGTYGGGLLRYQDGYFRLFTVRDGLFDNTAFQILEDQKGALWISCNRGIYRIRRQDLHDFAAGKLPSVPCDSFGAADGMISSECNGNAQPAGWKTRDHSLWFPTTRGIVAIDPENLKDNLLPPPVVISSVIIDKQNMDLFQAVSAPPGLGQLEFYYSGLSFVAPDKVRFRYRLVGFDKEWVDAGTRRAAFYTNISPGDYTFQVSACNNDGLWNDRGASYTFRLAPHFHQTIWFYMLAAILVAMAMFGLYRWRVYALLQREKILKERVEESLAQIKVLGGLIPICASCKKIRDDKGFWNNLEEYINNHSEATFSHGICPVCMEELYGDLLKEKELPSDVNGCV